MSLVAGASFLETFAGILDAGDIVQHWHAKSSAAVFRGWTADPASRVLIAEHPRGRAPIGYAVLTTPEDLPLPLGDTDIELRRIYTLLTARGTGLGAALMTRVLGEAARLGKERVLLGVYGGNVRARAFYERQGFAIVGTRQFKVGATLHDDFVYARSL